MKIISLHNISKKNCIFLLILFSIFVRFFTSQVVDEGGDAFFKWMVIKQYVLHNSIQHIVDHHIARWSINIPVFFIQKYISTEHTAYYIWPFFTATITTIFSFLILEKLRGLRTGLVGATLVTLSEPMLRQGTQFLPMGATVAYLLATIYFLIRWRHNGRISNTLISSFFLFLAWGAKVTSIYYFP